MNWKLELVVIPVADVDRAKAFYTEQVGFIPIVDNDAGTPGSRVVQMLPPGSACAIAFGSGLVMADDAGPVQGLHLVVDDIDAARSQLHGRGLEMGDAFHYRDGAQHPGVHPGRADYMSFFRFEDPDANVWLVQEVGYRPGGGG